MFTKYAAMLKNITYLRYIMASAVALVVDMGLFMLLISSHMASVPAAMAGYCMGIATHWLISSRAVFQDRVSERGSQERTRQKAMFFASALLGLAVTMGIVGIADISGIDPRLGKLAAVVVAFQLTYMLRNHVIFRTS